MSEGRKPDGPLAIRWSDRAVADLERIGDYIAADNPTAARRLVEMLLTQVERVAALPLSGRVVPERARADIREVIHRNYRVVYQLREGSIEILTVFEGHRLFPEDVAGSGTSGT